MLRETYNEALTEALRQRIASRSFRIPVIPEVAWKVIRIANDPESNATALVNVVRSEPLLAACVIRVANSAAYYRGGMLDSLPLAIARLGMTLVRDIALATAVNARMFDAAIFERPIREISHHALATALWAKEVALLARRNRETAFVCGLLHSIGKPVLLQAALDSETFDWHDVDHAALLAEIDSLHTEAGAIVLARWDLSPAVIDAVAHQALPRHASTGKPEARIIRAASALAAYTLDGTPERSEIELLAEFPELAITSEQVDKLFAAHGKVLFTMEAIRD
ncbi:MAG: HDOD domain-containing protein [Thiotrichales bacterium]